MGIASRNQWLVIGLIGVVAFALGLWRDVPVFTWIGVVLGVLGLIGFIAADRSPQRGDPN